MSFKPTDKDKKRLSAALTVLFIKEKGDHKSYLVDMGFDRNDVYGKGIFLAEAMSQAVDILYDAIVSAHERIDAIDGMMPAKIVQDYARELRKTTIPYDAPKIEEALRFATRVVRRRDLLTGNGYEYDLFDENGGFLAVAKTDADKDLAYRAVLGWSHDIQTDTWTRLPLKVIEEAHSDKPLVTDQQLSLLIDIKERGYSNMRESSEELRALRRRGLVRIAVPDENRILNVYICVLTESGYRYLRERGI